MSSAMPPMAFGNERSASEQSLVVGMLPGASFTAIALATGQLARWDTIMGQTLFFPGRVIPTTYWTKYSGLRAYLSLLQYITSTALSPTLARDLYARMLLTRMVDDGARRLYAEGHIDFVASCRGHEAAQVGSAVCIEVGKDFTLPYYRDLGVVLTLGMTPHEAFRTCLQTYRQEGMARGDPGAKTLPRIRHWGYHKHNTVTGSAPVATQLLHAAGIAFSCKLSDKAEAESVVTVAYCGDGATNEPDFLEGLRFAALHQLPVVFICEQDCVPASADQSSLSCIDGLALPAGLTHQRLDGSDVVAVYSAMRTAMQQARTGHGPTLLEMHVTRSIPDLHLHAKDEECDVTASPANGCVDPLVRCQHYLQAQGAWDETWATQLSTRISTEVERALQDAMRDMLQS
jgi:2-oxoisovalerate dehydrogenase E1 component alpha subunit